MSKQHKSLGSDEESSSRQIKRRKMGYMSDLTHDDYSVGWLCALSKEQTAAIAMLDEEHPVLSKPPNDPNTYTLGSVGKHNVVIACLPSGRIGNNSSATAASWMFSTFRSIEFGVMVGIGGGIPPQVRLGDVVVSTPTNEYPGVVQWDMGKAEGHGTFKRTGSLNSPPSALLTALAKLETEHEMNGSKASQYLDDLRKKWPRLSAKYARPDLLEDVLFKPDYHHVTRKDTEDGAAHCEYKEHEDGDEASCRFCDRAMMIKTTARDSCVHYGLIASGNQVIKDAIFRDKVNKALGGSVRCVEMEAAGLMNDKPWIVIRGICDYADSHKNKKWQEYAAAMAAAFAKELLSVVSAKEIRQMPVVEESFAVSFALPEAPLADSFVGREEELALMAKELQSGNSRQVAVLHGLGGIGKTQIASTYARRYRDYYSAVFWFDCRDIDTLKKSFLNATDRILRDHPSLPHLKNISKTKNVDEAVEIVKEWLNSANNKKWLLIYDNLDNPKLPGNDDSQSLAIGMFLPTVEHGALIITTRSSHLKAGKQIHVQKFREIKQSLQVLSLTSQRDDLENDADARVLAHQLDGLPLALAAAGAYLYQASMSFAEYLGYYREKWLRLQERTPRLPSYEHTLYSTWDLSLDRLKQQSPSSAILLQLWAYFDNQDLWHDLLKDYTDGVPDWYQEITEDQISFDSTMRTLCSHGLVESNAISHERPMESSGYSMHGCVHAWTVYVLNRQWNSEMAQLAVTCVGRHVPSRRSSGYWATQQRLIRHANRCSYIIEKEIDSWVNEVSMFGQIESIGRLYKNVSQLPMAEKLLKLVLDAKTRSSLLGPSDLSTLNTMVTLADLYRKQERLDDSEKAYCQALHALQALPHLSQGCDSSNLEIVPEIIDRLGIIYWKQKRFHESEEMFARALQEKEKRFGKDDDSTLHTTNNFGLLLMDQGKLSDAKKLFQRAFEGHQDRFGPDNIATLNALNNLGLLCTRQGNFKEAEKLLKKALEGFEKICSGEEISLLEAVDNLGDLYAKSGRRDEAKRMYERALEGFQVIFGSLHDRCQEVMKILADLKQPRHEETLEPRGLSQ